MQVVITCVAGHGHPNPFVAQALDDASMRAATVSQTRHAEALPCPVGTVDGPIGLAGR